MQRMVSKLFANYGTEMWLRQPDREIAFRGFLQANRSRSWHNMDKVYSPLGEIPRGQYILYLPPEVEAQTGDRVRLEGVTYEIRRLKKMRMGDTVAYCWGLCVESGGDDVWGMS